LTIWREDGSLGIVGAQFERSCFIAWILFLCHATKPDKGKMFTASFGGKMQIDAMSGNSVQ
jgi:hypothetical protein